MQKTILLLLIILLHSCIIRIQDIGYRDISPQVKAQYFSEFNIEDFDKPANNIDSFEIQEVDHQDIKNILHRHRYNCIMLWSPYCKEEVCQSLSYYDKLVERFNKNNFKLIIISRTYDYKYIEQIVKDSHYTQKMYVIEYNPEYGHNIDRVHDRFAKDISGMVFESRPSYFFFKDTTFIKADEILNDSILETTFGIKQLNE